MDCPRCGASRLEARFSCLATRFRCPGCGASYGLEDLAPLLGDEAFAALAALVSDRYSDRV